MLRQSKEWEEILANMAFRTYIMTPIFRVNLMLLLSWKQAKSLAVL